MTPIANEVGTVVAFLLPFSHPLVEAMDVIESVAGGVWRVTRSFYAKSESAVRVHGLTLALEICYEPEFMMIPAVSYDGNRWGDGKEPTGWEYEGEPWSFASHRTAVAGGTFSRGQGLSVGLFADGSACGCGFSCSLFERDGRCVHRLIAPEQEMPRSYLQKGRLDAGYRMDFELQPGEPLTLAAIIVAGQGDYRGFLDIAWRQNCHEIRPWYEPERIWELGIAFARDCLWAEDGRYRGFSIGLTRDEASGGWMQRPIWRYESGWCGQNISLGCSMLCDYLIGGNADSLRIGLTVLDTWAAAMLPSGLLCVQYDALLGHMDLETLPISACNLGGSAEDFIEAWELSRQCGHQRPQYLAVAESILERMLCCQRPDGSYPSAFRADGSVLEEGGSTGGFVVPAMLKLHAVSGRAECLASAERAMAHYLGEFAKRGYTTAGALDSCCIDKESSFPLLSAALRLYAITKKPQYLSAAEDLAYYLSTWQWHHTVAYPEGCALSALDYDTFGGTAVSTQHCHIDPYGVRYVPLLLELAELTGQSIWRERARATWNNGTIGISDGSLEVMGRLRPRGSQDEAFMHTRWGDPFNVSQWLVAWPSAFRLEALRRTRFFSFLPL